MRTRTHAQNRATYIQQVVVVAAAAVALPHYRHDTIVIMSAITTHTTKPRAHLYHTQTHHETCTSHTEKRNTYALLDWRGIFSSYHIPYTYTYVSRNGKRVQQRARAANGQSRVSGGGPILN